MKSALVNKIQTTGSKKVILNVCCVIVVDYGESVTSVNPHSALVIQRRHLSIDNINNSVQCHQRNTTVKETTTTN